MDALLGKLINLGYEFFGILLPGTFLLLGLLLVWLAGGTLVPAVTFGTVPLLTAADAGAAFTTLLDWSLIGVLLLFFSSTYLLGHTLAWVARGGKREDDPNPGRILWATLRFRPPKAALSHHERFTPLREWAADRLLDGVEPGQDWDTFYLAAKALIRTRQSPSFLPTYQNKYTLHRSLAVTAAITFWLSVLLMVAGLICLLLGHPPSPVWLGTILLLIGSAVAVWGFANSYLYNWTLWGDYLIVEAYVQLRDDQ